MLAMRWLRWGALGLGFGARLSGDTEFVKEDGFGVQWLALLARAPVTGSHARSFARDERHSRTTPVRRVLYFGPAT